MPVEPAQVNTGVGLAEMLPLAGPESVGTVGGRLYVIVTESRRGVAVEELVK